MFMGKELEEIMAIIAGMKKKGEDPLANLKETITSILMGDIGIGEAIEKAFKDVERKAVKDFVGKVVENFKNIEETSGNAFESISAAIQQMGDEMVNALLVFEYVKWILGESAGSK